MNARVLKITLAICGAVPAVWGGVVTIGAYKEKVDRHEVIIRHLEETQDRMLELTQKNNDLINRLYYMELRRNGR